MAAARTSSMLRTFTALRVVQSLGALYLLGTYAFFFHALSFSPAPLKPLIVSILLLVYAAPTAALAYARPHLLARRYFALFAALDAGFFGALIWIAVTMRSDGECLLWMWDGVALGAYFADDKALGALMQNCRLDKVGYADVVLVLVSFVFTGLASGMLTLFFKKEEHQSGGGSIRSGKESVGSSSGEEGGRHA